MTRPLAHEQKQKRLLDLHDSFRQCRQCPNMTPPVILGRPVLSKIMLLGQAPGAREGALGRPFGWTAGKTLFQWFSSIGVTENTFRNSVYIAAVCRCFPGKANGGDRVPSKTEVASCTEWLKREMTLIEPELVIPVGRLAIATVTGLSNAPLHTIIGKNLEFEKAEKKVRVIALPHPSGLSAWHKTEPGKSLLRDALDRITQDEAWVETFPQVMPPNNTCA